ncbi:dihydrofolate reductase [Zooshikella marina]|uniref:Dihydrofolate reductase n=1 Tax=Zooshikella ganghwensis TaxID=202772 RepID=A0A4V1INM4_9GAMM|nr:dihydrofolate reductase family protein [Zooshikella ganghwensis]MBU2705107.1 dihydrofolate reductase [Zooshikella ganghwensis]RDH44241.1 dihydrofolate reductase [Zooshikella ganghwensis]
MQISVYIATSVDGFIARKNGDIDWLEQAGDGNNTTDFGYEDFMSSVTCLVMGRKTFEKVLSFPEWPYEKKRVILLSRTCSSIPPELEGKVELYSGEISALVDRLKYEGEQRVYIDGGVTIQSFLKAGLVDDITITRIPVIIGEGLPLFAQTGHDISLTHIATKAYDNGFVQSTYQC